MMFDWVKLTMYLWKYFSYIFLCLLKIKIRINKVYSKTVSIECISQIQVWAVFLWLWEVILHVSYHRDSVWGFHGYPITMMRNARVIIWVQSRKVYEERGEKRTEQMNGNRKSLRENRHHAHVWLSHYNILEKQLLSTAGMES